jgi:release factor glutamine methyltransferase
MFLKLRQWISAWIIKKIQRYGPHRVEILGNVYEISEDVFNQKFYYTSIFMAKHINVRSGDVVLDIGTGSGIQAITAGQTASRVIAVDINPEAVKYASQNAIANGLEKKISVMQSDLFSSLRSEDKFDVILFTPPYLNGMPKTDIDHALFDPEKELASRFFREVGKHLRPEGYIQMVYSSFADPEKVLAISTQSGWRHSLIAEEQTISEKFLIYKFTLV